jgi:hypothetical protein
MDDDVPLPMVELELLGRECHDRDRIENTSMGALLVSADMLTRSCAGPRGMSRHTAASPEVQGVEASQNAIVRLVEVARLGRLVDTGGVTRSAAARAGIGIKTTRGATSDRPSGLPARQRCQRISHWPQSHRRGHHANTNELGVREYRPRPSHPRQTAS